MKTQNTNNAGPLAGTKKLVNASLMLWAAVLLSLATAQADRLSFISGLRARQQLAASQVHWLLKALGGRRF